MTTTITPMIQYTRDSSGHVMLKAQNAENVEFKGVGIVSGNGTISFGSTGEDNHTMVSYITEKDQENEFILANDSGMNYNILGEGANVKSMGGNATRMIEVSAINSNIDLSNTSGSQALNMTESARDNKIQLGVGSDYYVDAGDYNQVVDNGGYNNYETKSTAFGTVIVGGAGKDDFLIGGKYAVISGGYGSNSYKVMSNGNEITEDSAFGNIIIGGDGNEYYEDHSLNNFFYGAGGADSVKLTGIDCLVDLSDNYGEVTGTISSTSIESMIFVDKNKTYDGKTYSLFQKMKELGFDINEFLTTTEFVDTKDMIKNHTAISVILGQLTQVLSRADNA